jgi:hypothetical protein
MGTCKCGKEKNHGNMTRDERIKHLRDCLDDAMDKIECVRDEIELLVEE